MSELIVYEDMEDYVCYEVDMLPTKMYDKDEADKVIAHNKYKRCLAMSEMCNANYFRQYMFKPNFWKRWHNRWLKIAEKFKETK